VQQRFVGSVILLCLTLACGAHSLSAQGPAPRGEGAPLSWCRAEAEQAARNPSADAVAGELRIVDSHRYNFITIVYNVFEHLMELDKDGKLVPRLAAEWRWRDDRTLEVHLRQGVKFHNGEAFDAEIVKLNWDENIRLQQPHLAGQFLNFTAGTRLEVVDPYTVRFVFPEPDGAALIKLSSMHMGNRQFYAEHGWGEKHW
jgi:ABC-type transport system substrate-binding protein